MLKRFVCYPDDLALEIEDAVTPSPLQGRHDAGPRKHLT